MSEDTIQVVCSAFEPSSRLFCSVVPVLDRQKIQVHSHLAGNSGKLRSELVFDKGIEVSSIKWMTESSKNSTGKPKNKRKRSDVQENEQKTINDFVIVIGTTKGNLLVFSPSKQTLLYTLTSPDSKKITSISCDANSIWTCDISGRICEWSIGSRKVEQSFVAPDAEVRIVQILSRGSGLSSELLLASTSVYLIDSANPTEVAKTFSGFSSQVSELTVSSATPGLFIAFSENERTAAVYSTESNEAMKYLNAESDVRSLSLAVDDSFLALVTEDGATEIFAQPFSTKGKASTKSRRGSIIETEKAAVQIIVKRSSSERVVVQDSFIAPNGEVLVVWLENGTTPVIESASTFDGTKPVTDIINITAARKSTTLDSRGLSTNDPAAVKRYTEVNTVVTTGDDVHELEIESEEEENGDNEDEGEDEDDDDDEEEEEEEEEEDGTLADRLDALGVNDDKKMNGSSNGQAKFTSVTSFSTVLSQALKTNDHSLLETCLIYRDNEMIKTSVQRLNSSLAVVLLERLAEKLARQPTRATQLTVWIKWVMVAHGGYLVTLPHLLKTLSTLHATLAQRSSVLPRLLALEGKLDLLAAQMELRKEMAQSGASDVDESDSEEAFEYIEDGIIANGEDYENSNDEEDDDEASGYVDLEADEDDDDEEDGDGGDEEEEEEEDDEDGMSDVEEEDENVSEGSEGSDDDVVDKGRKTGNGRFRSKPLNGSTKR